MSTMEGMHKRRKHGNKEIKSASERHQNAIKAINNLLMMIK